MKAKILKVYDDAWTTDLRHDVGIRPDGLNREKWRAFDNSPCFPMSTYRQKGTRNPYVSHKIQIALQIMDYFINTALLSKIYNHVRNQRNNYEIKLNNVLF